MDRLASMAVFVKAADLGSFTAAAATLGMTSQMVGKHVSFLEARLGAQLIHRTTRRQSLTATGQAFYERCRTILAEVEAAEAVVDGLSTTPRGRLRVNAPVTFGACALAPLVTRYLATFPDVEVELTLSDHYVDVVDQGYDAVIRLGQLRDSSLAAHALAPYRLLACASPEYLARRGVPTSPEELAFHECLEFVNWAGVPYSEWQFEKAGRVHAVQVHSRFQVNDGRILRSAALDGCGIVLQSDVVVRDDLASGRLIQVLPGYDTPCRPMHVLFSGSRPMAPKLRTFVDAVVDAFGHGALPVWRTP